MGSMTPDAPQAFEIIATSVAMIVILYILELSLNLLNLLFQNPTEYRAHRFVIGVMDLHLLSQNILKLDAKFSMYICLECVLPYLGE